MPPYKFIGLSVCGGALHTLIGAEYADWRSAVFELLIMRISAHVLAIMRIGFELLIMRLSLRIGIVDWL